MKLRSVSLCLVGLAVLMTGTPGALGAVELVLRPHEPVVRPGAFVDVDLIAVSDDGTALEFSTLDAVLVWEAAAFELAEVIDSGQHTWSFFFGLASDGRLDGLNNSLSDGDALFQAVSLFPATASADGLVIGTFRFVALADSTSASIALVPQLGSYSKTQVLQPGAVDVTGGLSGTAVSVVSNALISAQDVTLPAGRVSNIEVTGRVFDVATFGAVITVILVPRPGSFGSVSFTAAPPADINQLGDPWPGAGLFSPFDTDISGSSMLNGSVDDNATFVPEVIAFDGPLSGFPVVASVDAVGSWDIRLCGGACTGEDPISWWDAFPEPVPTALEHGVLRIVDIGDGDGDDAIELGDFAELQACFTGAVGPADPPAFSTAPAMRCVVYDFDDDGDVDAADFAAFRGAMAISGP